MNLNNDVMPIVRDLLATYDDNDKEGWADKVVEDLGVLLLQYDMEGEDAYLE